MTKQDMFDNKLITMTTIIYNEVIKDGRRYESQGTGFFYSEISPADPNVKGPQWHRYDKFWLVTNRHMVLKKIDNVEYVPNQFTFFFREYDNGTINWKKITMCQNEFLNCLKLHKDKNVDIALLDVTSYILKFNQEFIQNKTTKLMYPLALTNHNLPLNQPLKIEVTSDIVVVSYPKGFYDEANKFPIVKSGIVASGWGLKFKNLPIFQIDAQLFPGSSGGLVLSKPTNVAVINGELKYSTEEQFVFLGVYSGEYVWNSITENHGEKHIIESSFGLGSVWYSYLIPEIINEGIKWTK